MRDEGSLPLEWAYRAEGCFVALNMTKKALYSTNKTTEPASWLGRSFLQGVRVIARPAQGLLRRAQVAAQPGRGCAGAWRQYLRARQVWRRFALRARCCTPWHVLVRAPLHLWAVPRLSPALQ